MSSQRKFSQLCPVPKRRRVTVESASSSNVVPKTVGGKTADDWIWEHTLREKPRTPTPPRHMMRDNPRTLSPPPTTADKHLLQEELRRARMGAEIWESRALLAEARALKAEDALQRLATCAACEMCFCCEHRVTLLAKCAA